MRHNPRPQEMYRHFKGNLYQVRCLARHSETRELMVVYQAMYGTFEIFVRPLAMFMEEVDHEKYPSVRQRYRFELLQDIADDDYEEEPASLTEKLAQEKPAALAEPLTEEEPEADYAAGAAAGEALPKEPEQAEEQLNIDPLVLAFLDADSYQQRLSILDSLHNRITDSMINTMAVSVDLEIKDGDLEDRYMELRSCLRTFERYECNRLR